MASLPPGTQLGQGRYTVVRELNRGGTAVVYEGLQAGSGHSVALKVVAIDDERRAAVTRAACEREVAFARRFTDAPGLCHLLDFFAEGDGALVLVWELVRGADLLDFLNAQGGVLPEPLAARLFAQLLDTVQLVHANGFAHRDLKPENAMVDATSGRVRLIDFGLSKRHVSACTLGVGTPDYMAPELLGGGADWSVLQTRRTGSYSAAACDAWSLGGLLYLLATGHYAFEDPDHPSNVLSTLANIARGAYRPLPPHLSAPLQELIAGLLQVDPARRLTLAAARHHPWLAAHGQGCPALPPVVDAAGEAAAMDEDAAVAAGPAAGAQEAPQAVLPERAAADDNEAAAAGSCSAAAGMELDSCAAPQQQRFSFHQAARQPTPSTPRVSLAATAAPAALQMTAGSSSGGGGSPAAPAAPEPTARPRAAGFFCARLLGLIM